MNNKDQKYNNLITRIKAAKPELYDPQGLTAEIMSAVTKLSDKPKTSMPLRIVSWASSAAVILLLGIFLSEYSTPDLSSTQQINVPSYDSYSFTEIDIGNDNTLDKIYDVIRERREAKKERKAFRTTIINKHQSF